MLRRLASSAALVAAAVLLAGCTPPDPPTDDEVVMRATTSLNEFYRIVDEQFEAGASSPEAFVHVAESDLASQYSGEVQDQIDEGIVSRGVPHVSNVELRGREASSYSVDFCTDGSSVSTTTPTGTLTGEVVAWSATFEHGDENASLRMSTLEVRGDESLCGS